MLDMFFTHFFTNNLLHSSEKLFFMSSISAITIITFQKMTNFGPLSFALGRGLLKREMLGTETCETYF